MGINNYILVLWDQYFHAYNKPDYITKNILHPDNIDNVKKKSAQRAILWLISKTPHTIEEIADHFEIAPELVKCLIEELMAVNKVIQSGKYYLNLKQ